MQVVQTEVCSSIPLCLSGYVSITQTWPVVVHILLNWYDLGLGWKFAKITLFSFPIPGSVVILFM